MRLMTRAEVPPRGRATLQASTRETSVSTAPPEIDDIRRKMAQIRRDLHQDVKSVVEGAEAATDWKRFIRHYPWASMGVALAAGYLVVPRRQKATTLQVAPAEIARAVAVEMPRAPEPEKKNGKGLLGTVFGLVAPVALRAAQGYALQFAEQWLAQKVAQQAELHPELAAMLAGQQSPPQGPPGSQGPRGPQVGPHGAPRF
jgi:hypothetical protein